MPKIGDPLIFPIIAVTALVGLYRKDPDFENEFHNVCEPYLLLILELAIDYLEYRKDEVLLTVNEYKTAINKLVEKMKASKAKHNSKGQIGTVNEFQSCYKSLDKFAYKWNLKIPRAGLILFISRMTDEIENLGIKMRLGKSYHPYLSEQVAPFDFGPIYAWMLCEFDQTQLIKEFRIILSNWMKKIKAKGLLELPSATRRHAQWWFRYHVKGKDWEDIANEEASVNPEGGPHPENIRKAVIKFSKLIGFTEQVF